MSVANIHSRRGPYPARKKGIRTVVVFSLIFLFTLSVLSPVLADATSRKQAKRIHDRLVGTPPSEAVLNQMDAAIIANPSTGPIDAAYIAMNNKAFYNVTLKNFATPWTNEDQTIFADLNDYTATVIGMIRDDVDFRLALSGNIIYVGDPSLGLPAYAGNNNNHYRQMESRGVDMSDVNALRQQPQDQVTGIPAAATAGVMTTRAAARAFFYAGTNRAMFRFTLMNHLCNDLEQVQDTSRVPDRIRQDVSRSPGGDSRLFLNGCIGCHSGMDPMAQAFAYYEWQYDSASDPDGSNGQLIYTANAVQGKYLINADNFEFGYVTTDDGWDNYWRAGPNSLLGWDAGLPGSGNGAKSMGEELANSRAFSECQATKVFKTVCLRAPGDAADRSQISTMANDLEGNAFHMKQAFAEAAAYCKD